MVVARPWGANIPVFPVSQHNFAKFSTRNRPIGASAIAERQVALADHIPSAGWHKFERRFGLVFSEKTE
jgi:hypothetical protein